MLLTTILIFLHLNQLQGQAILDVQEWPSSGNNNDSQLTAGWSEWSIWSPCDGICGTGQHRRFRTCRLSGSKSKCEGPDFEIQACEHVQPCPVNGAWTNWIEYLACPSDVPEVCKSPAGKYQQVLQRFCSNPEPSYGGRDCDGSDFKFVDCIEALNCTQGGRWSAWKRGPCSVTCGRGIETLSRSCLDEKLNGRKCTGPNRLVQECRAPISCHVDGNWSAWREVRPCPANHCSSLSAESVRVLERSCSSPAPNGGTDCIGDAVKVEACVDVYRCGAGKTVNVKVAKSSGDATGIWSPWQPVGSCAVTCGQGLQRRIRRCLSIEVACEGPAEDVMLCRMPPCPTGSSYSTLFPPYRLTLGELLQLEASDPTGISAEGFSQWTDWSACDSNKCQKQVRWRLCRKRDGCGSLPDEEVRSCHLASCAITNFVAEMSESKSSSNPLATSHIAYLTMTQLLLIVWLKLLV